MNIKNKKFWGEDGLIGISNIFKKHNFLEVIPQQYMSDNEKLNSITRLCIYGGIILSFLTTNGHYLVYSTICIIAIYVFYNLKNDSNQLTRIDENCVVNKNINENLANNKGYKRKIKKSDFISPTKHNPFMNIMPGEDFTDKIDCISKTHDSSSRYEDLQEDIEQKFGDGLFRDISDIYGKSSSQRQFYTMPNTSIVNNQEGFAEWLYKSPSTCKEGNNLSCNSLVEPRLSGNLSNFC